MFTNGMATGDFAAFVDRRSGLVAIDPRTGDVRWVSEFESFVATEPAITDDLVVAATPRGLVALDRTTGRPCWFVAALPPEVFQQPTVIESHVVLHSVLGGVTVVQVRDVVTGRLQWERPIDAPASPPVAVSDGKVLVAGHGADVLALDLGTGAVLWGADLAGRPVGISIADHRVFVGYAGAVAGVVVLDLDDGAVAWQAGVDGHPRLAVGAGVVIVSDGTRIHVLDAADGTVRWIKDDAPRLSYDKSQPVIAGELGFLKDSRANRVIGVDLASGDVQFEIPLGTLADSPPVVIAGDLLLNVDRDGILTAHR